ncbi:CHAP domain-containing protein [Nonomuraea sp. NPDC049028]|uniref:CHAP domain-containing protein n=1 Tax=Nonomuraea sp. NPDC049028 TaxID=3364348 RepID=UPI00371AC216
MAKSHLFRATKSTFAHAVLGVSVAAAAFAGQSAAHADTATAHAAAAPAHAAAAAKSHPESEVKAKATVSRVLALAKAQVGTTENAYGGGTKFQKWYMNSPRALETLRRDGGTRADYLNAAWCSMFVSWVGEQSGARSMIGWDAYTVEHAKWFANNNHWGTTPKPGAVVFFSWGGSKSLDDIEHVGFVVKDNHDGTISTIEGNTGNGSVQQRVRPTSQVVGYGYPNYGA